MTHEEKLRKDVRELMRPVEWAMTERVAAILAELGDAMLQHSRVERDNLRERVRDLQERLETAEARVKELEAKLGDYLDHVCARDAAVIVRPPEDA